jgi:hypothetical protein
MRLPFILGAQAGHRSGCGCTTCDHARFRWVSRHRLMLGRALYFCRVSGCRKPRSAATYSNAQRTLAAILGDQ